MDATIEKMGTNNKGHWALLSRELDGFIVRGFVRMTDAKAAQHAEGDIIQIPATIMVKWEA